MQEAEFGTDDNGRQVGGFFGANFCSEGTTGTCFCCKSPARYGTDRNTARFNRVLSIFDLEALMVSAGVTNDRGDPKFLLQGCSRE